MDKKIEAKKDIRDRAAAARLQLHQDLEHAGKKKEISQLSEEVYKYSQRMFQKYSEAHVRKVHAFHGLIGSTITKGEAPVADLEGEDSIFVFLQQMREKLLGPQKSKEL